MSSFPGSPRLVKGGIVLLELDTSAVRRIVVLRVRSVPQENGCNAKPIIYEPKNKMILKSHQLFTKCYAHRASRSIGKRACSWNRVSVTISLTSPCIRVHQRPFLL